MMRRPLLISILAIIIVACAGAGPKPAAPGALAAESPVSPSPTAALMAAPTSSPPETTSPTTLPPEQPYQFHGELDGEATMVALLTETIEVFASPDDETPFLVQESATIFGNNQVLALIDQPSDGWARVNLPGRPNDRSGWVKTDDLHLFVVGGEILIDLDTRTLVYTFDGEEVLTTPVAIGTSRNPTPTGSFYVTDSVRVTGPPGPFGPYALALSGRSDTITEFNGGDGIIGIHGTNRPNLIGEAVSLGCIRLPNDAMTRLWEMVPVGTPVEIVGG